MNILEKILKIHEKYDGGYKLGALKKDIVELFATEPRLHEVVMKKRVLDDEFYNKDIIIPNNHKDFIYKLNNEYPDVEILLLLNRCISSIHSPEQNHFEEFDNGKVMELLDMLMEIDWEDEKQKLDIYTFAKNIGDEK